MKSDPHIEHLVLTSEDKRSRKSVAEDNSVTYDVKTLLWFCNSGGGPWVSSGLQNTTVARPSNQIKFIYLSLAILVWYMLIKKIYIQL